MIASVFDSPGCSLSDAAANDDGVRLVVDCGALRSSSSDAPSLSLADEKKRRGTVSVVSVPKSSCWSQIIGSSACSFALPPLARSSSPSTKATAKWPSLMRDTSAVSAGAETRWKKGAVWSPSKLYTFIQPSSVRPIALIISVTVPAGSRRARPSTTSSSTASLPSLVYVTRRTSAGNSSFGAVK